MADGISFSVLARDLASRTFREVGREAWAMALKVKAANEAMDKSFGEAGGHSQFGMWAKAIILGLPLIPPLVVATTNALAGLNSVLVSTIPGVGFLAAALIANFKYIKASQPFTDLTTAWQKFGEATRADVMKPVVTGMKILTDLMRVSVPIVRAFADVLNGFLVHMRQEMAGPAFDKFLNWVRTVGAANFGNILRSLENLVVGLANLGMAFSNSGTDITTWLLNITTKFRNWSRDLQGPGAIGGFISYFKTTWPQLKALVAELVTALSHVLTAVAPLSSAFMQFFTLLLKGFNAIPISVLTDLMKGFIALKVAAYAFAGAQAAVNIAMAANPIGVVLVLLAALAVAFLLAYRHSETFRKAVKDAFHQIGDAARDMWRAAKPVVDWFKSPEGAKAMSTSMKLAAAGVRVSATILTAALHNISMVARVVFPIVVTQIRLMVTAARVAAAAIRTQAGIIHAAITVIRVAWVVVGTVVRVTGAAIRAVVHAVGATFHALGATVRSVTANIRAALSGLRAAWHATLAVLRIVPGFGWISSLIGLLHSAASAASAAAGAIRAVASAAAGLGSIHMPSIPSLPSLPHISLPKIPGKGKRKFASGGRPPLHQVSLVGERGPELFIPDRPGRIVSNDETRRMLSGVDRGGDDTRLHNLIGDLIATQRATLAELAALRELVGRLPRTYQHQRRLAGGTA